MRRSRRLLAAVGIAATLSAVAGTSVQAQTATSSFVRGVYGRDDSASRFDTIKSTGFNTVTISPLSKDMETLHQRGLKGVVWLWDYDNGTCSFERSADWVRGQVRDLADNPGVLAYQIADEPRANKCPNAPAQLEARTDLIHSIDPGAPTFIAMAIRAGGEYFPYQDFVDSADVLGLVVYPCTFKYGCRFKQISAAISEAKKDGVDRYWAVMQDFGKNWYRQPTAAELRRQFDAWSTSTMEGYLVYHWGHGNLDDKPRHLEVLSQQNARTFVADVTPPSPPSNLRVTWDAPDVRLAWDAAQDDVGVVTYKVVEDGDQIATTSSLSWTNRWPVWGPHTYSVMAKDAAGNLSAPSDPVTTG